MDRRITVTIGEKEFAVLQSAAKREFRPVRDQARYMLNQALHQAAQGVCITANERNQSNVQPIGQ